MELAARRPLLAIATLTTASALALAPITIAPTEIPTPVRISTQVVQLTDAWSDLFTVTAASLTQLGSLVIGTNNSYPLPNPTFPLAPVATQLVLNQLIYVAQLFTGNAGAIPVEIGTHLNQVGAVLQQFATAGPSVILQQLIAPFYAIQQSIQYIANSTNKLAALFQAPALFLNYTLNADTGLLGQYGPIGLPLIFRNLLTTALYTTPPAIVLPFKKAAAAASTPKPTTATVAPTAPSGTASSARTKPKASASSSRKAASAKAKAKANSSGAGGGQGHSKRG